MIVFDLDGTLVDSEREIFAAMAFAWATVIPESPFPREQLRIGPPLLPMIAAMTPLLPEERRAELVRVFREGYDASDWSLTLPYPGVLDLLASLAPRGIAVATNKRIAPSLAILERWFPGRFALVCGIDGVRPDDGTVPGDKTTMLRWLAARVAGDHVLVGDTTGDVAAARAAGFRAVAVTWGYEAADVLAAQSPDALVHDAAGLSAALTA